MNVYGVIMAGGVGSRFWPASRIRNPKQLLKLSGDKHMINVTIDRLNGVTSKEALFVVTNEGHAEKLAQVTGNRLFSENILSEPAMRNTAACIGFAAMVIKNRFDEQGVMCVLAADHVIGNVNEFRNTLDSAVDAAAQGNQLVTIGIRPTFPSTGYGYISYEEQGKPPYKVREFVEKPDYETARHYLKSGNYLWNSGMFVWKVSTILNAFKQFLPEVYKKLADMSKCFGTKMEQKKIEDIYPTIPKISIDYGIMEKSKNVLVIPGDFGWNDVGSWDALDDLYGKDEYGNILRAQAVTIDTRDSIIYSTNNNKLIATVGLENVIVVDTDDAILVCSKDMAQDVKKVVSKIKEDSLAKYL